MGPMTFSQKTFSPNGILPKKGFFAYGLFFQTAIFYVIYPTIQKEIIFNQQILRYS